MHNIGIFKCKDIGRVNSLLPCLRQYFYLATASIDEFGKLSRFFFLFRRNEVYTDSEKPGLHNYTDGLWKWFKSSSIKKQKGVLIRASMD